MTSPVQYVVRGFDFLSEDFESPTGKINDLPTFIEKTVDTQVEAVIEMLSNKLLKTMCTPEILMRSSEISIEGELDVGIDDPKNIIHVIDLSIGLRAGKAEVRSMKTTLRETIKRWAEKSRVKGRRGFRLSAIKTPKFEYFNDCSIMRVQVILSTAVLYSSTEVDVSVYTENSFTDDLYLLKKRLIKSGIPIVKITYLHSLLGAGEQRA